MKRESASHKPTTIGIVMLTAALICNALANRLPARGQEHVRPIDVLPVESWQGTLHNVVEKSGQFMCGAGLCTGYLHEANDQTWKLAVSLDGSVNGTVSVSVDSSYRETAPEDACGFYIVSGVPSGTFRNCRYSMRIDQPTGEVSVQGQRPSNGIFSGGILITNMSILKDCRETWHSDMEMYDEFNKFVGYDGLDMESSCLPVNRNGTFFELEAGSDGRLPRALLNGSDHQQYSSAGYSSYFSGYLVGYILQPGLRLDKELLESSTFLSHVPVGDLFKADVAWNSPDAGLVHWKMGELATEQVGPTRAQIVPKDVDVGAQAPGSVDLTVQAENSLGKKSQPETTQIAAAPVPQFASPPSFVFSFKQGGAVKYKRSLIKWPDPAFKGEVTVPTLIPFFGDAPIGISDSQINATVEVLSTSQGSLKGEGKTGFEAAGGSVTGKLSGTGEGVLDATNGWQIPKASVNFEIAGQIAKKESLLKAIPSLAPAFTLIERLSPGAANYIKDKAYAKLELGPKVGLGLEFASQNGSLEFKARDFNVGIGFKVSTVLDLIKNELSASVGVGGDINGVFQVPAPYFKQAEIKFQVFSDLRFWKCVIHGEKSWSIILAPGGAVNTGAAFGAGARSPADWLCPTFVGATVANSDAARWAGVLRSSSSSELTDVLLMQNVYSQANPALASRVAGNTLSLAQVWTYDRTDLPSNSSGEIVWSQGDGLALSVPISLTSDNRDDWNPQVTYLPNGKPLVLWQRMDTATPGDMNADPSAFVSHAQIAARVAGDNAALAQISLSGSLNHRPQLAATDTGALAIWVDNQSNQIMGSATAPDRILSATYNATSSAWSTPTVVVDNLAGLLGLHLATNGEQAALVYSLDTDGDLTTSSDRELYHVRWQGSSWSAPTRLTNNSVPDEAPQLALSSTGAPSLVWQQGNTLRFLTGDWNAPSQVLDLPGAAERPDYSLVTSTDSSLALVWQEVQPAVTGIGYAIYDGANGRWSDERFYAPPDPGADATAMATGIAPALAPAIAGQPARLLLAYQLAHVDSVTTTIGGIAYPNQPVVKQHDLRFASLPLAADMAVAPIDLTAPDSATVQATVHNLGALAATNVPVILRSGGPFQQRQITVTLPLIGAGQSLTATFTLSPTMRTAGVFRVIVNPGNTPPESDITNNTAYLYNPLLLDWLPPVAWPDGISLRLRLTQMGALYTNDPISFTLRTDDVAGPIIGSGDIAFPLSPTLSITATMPITSGVLGPGRHLLFWVLDPTAVGKNVYDSITVQVAPDLAADPVRIGFGQGAGATTPFIMDVVNRGNWPSPDSAVAVFNGRPGQYGVHQLGRFNVPAMAPGLTAEVSGTLNLAGLPVATSGLSGLYALLDPDETLVELNENNNLVASGDVVQYFHSSPSRIFLPILLQTR